MHIFFDLDGTLTNPKLGITRCIQSALQQLDAPVPHMDELTWCIGPPLHHSFSELLDSERAERAVALYRERFADIGWSENEPYDGIHDQLAQLYDAGGTLYVASSKPKVFVERILEHFELDHFFHAVYGARLDEGGGDKSELLQGALSTHSLQGEQAVMVGDRKYDAIGARDNNMTFAGACYGFGGVAELEAAGSHALIHSPHHLSQTLLPLV